MRFLVLPSLTPKPKSKYIQQLSLCLAVIILGMVVAQLFTYEHFSDAIAELGFGSGSMIIAPLIVTLQVAALPFLLFMPLKSTARTISMVCGWLITAWWAVAALVSNISHSTSSGFLGATVDLPSGWWSVFFALSLAVLTAWVSWGMWPGNSSKK